MDIYLEGSNHLRGPMKAFLLRSLSDIHRRTIALDIIPCGSGDNAIRRCARSADATLLIDSEAALSTQLVDRVAGQIGSANRAFFMVRFMESWFLADRNTLAGYFGPGFRTSALPQNPNIEEVSKQDIESGLRDATRNCAKRRYLKGRDDAPLLEQLNPAAVYATCPNFARLIDFLRNRATG